MVAAAAAGAAEALRAFGRQEGVTIVSVDGGCPGVQNVADGVIGATSQQYPRKMAEMGIEAIAAFVPHGGGDGRCRLGPARQQTPQLAHVAAERCLVVQTRRIGVRQLHFAGRARRMRREKVVQRLVVRQQHGELQDRHRRRDRRAQRLHEREQVGADACDGEALCLLANGTHLGECRGIGARCAIVAYTLQLRIQRTHLCGTVQAKRQRSGK